MSPPGAAFSTLRWLVGIVLVGVVLAAVIVLPWRPAVVRLVAYARDAGVVGVLLFSMVYIVAALLLLPASLLTLGAGFAYGPWWGLVLVSPVSVLAATAAFLLGRTAARGWVDKRIANNPRFSAIDGAVGENGFKMVFLLRLSPVVPFNLLNFALGVTRVRLRDYVLASFVGMLPGTIMYVYLGSLVSNTAHLLEGTQATSTTQSVLFYGGLVATVVVAVLVARAAKRALKQALPE